MGRNQFFLLGLVLLFLGAEFRAIDSATLTPEFTKFLAKRAGPPIAAVSSAVNAVTPEQKPILKKTVQPPDWLGWSLLSIGCVLVLHAWGMPREG